MPESSTSHSKQSLQEVSQTHMSGQVQVQLLSWLTPLCYSLQVDCTIEHKYGVSGCVLNVEVKFR